MNMKKLLPIVALLLPAGCAAYSPGPLSASHPANVDAGQAPPRPGSKTLAYTRADIPSSQPMLDSARAGTQDNRQTAQSEQQMITADGKVVATVPNASQIVVEHGESKGFMEAMTMGYRVEPPSLLEGLKFGDKVRFTIDVPKKAIVKIEKLK
jgi:Cu/Ag efflux protein CusF